MNKYAQHWLRFPLFLASFSYLNVKRIDSKLVIVIMATLLTLLVPRLSKHTHRTQHLTADCPFESHFPYMHPVCICAVIVDAGLGTSSDSWWLVYHEISKFTKVICQQN